MSCFNVVVLDDQAEFRDGSIANAQNHFMTQFIEYHPCKTIEECVGIAKNAKSIGGQWMFILDCDLSHEHHGKIYGGYEAWSRVMAEFVGESLVFNPLSDEIPFAALYSQSLVELINALKMGGDLFLRSMRPELYDRLDERLMPRCEEWMKARQRYLLQCSNREERLKLAQAITAVLADVNQDAATLGAMKLNIELQNGRIEVWRLSELFPVEWAEWTRYKNIYVLKQIRHKLLPVLPSVWNEFSTMIFGSLVDTPELASLTTPALVKIDHVINIMNGCLNDGDNKKSEWDRIWNKIQKHCQLLHGRQLDALTCVSPELSACIRQDTLFIAIEKAASADDGESLAKALGIGDYVRGRNYIRGCIDPSWTAPPDGITGLENKERDGFVRLPIPNMVSESIFGILNSQAIKHGGCEVKFIATHTSKAQWCVFQTQNKSVGNPFEADHVSDHLNNHRNPQRQKLSELVEIVCGLFCGRIIIVQEPRDGRTYEPEYSVYIECTTDNILAYRCSALPHSVELPEGLVPLFEDEDGFHRPDGTFYLIEFPHWEGGLYGSRR